jgi:TolB-like protein/Tfp pilus assembly protein PilF
MLNRDDALPETAPNEAPDGDRLDSWKEIAAYLKRDVRTVHRWESEQGLPVRRHIHKKRATVYAYKAELEAWWNARQPHVAEEIVAAQAVRSPHFRRILALALSFCAVLGVGGYLARNRIWPMRAPPTGQVTLVVLPFENTANDPEQDYFSDGMTEEMTTKLATLQPERLRVIAIASAMKYKHSGKGIDQIARELGVDYVLESSLRRSDGRVRITAGLIRAQDQTHLWAQSYERELHDVLALQSDVASAISREIVLQLTPNQQLRLASSRAINPGAHEAYLTGLFFWNKFTRSGMEKSIEYFQQAIDKDPGYAPPHARMARAYGLLGNFGILRPEQAYPQQKQAALRAIELDPMLDEAHSALGWTKVFYERDWAGARDEFQRAVELSPNSPTAHQGLAMYFVAVGQFDLAHAEILRAQELDPGSLNIKADVGWFLFFARRYDDSIEQLRKILEMDPNFSITHVFLAQAYQEKGMFDQAIVESEAAMKLFDDSATRIGSLGHAYAVAGRKREARQQLARLKMMSAERYVPRYTMALIYTGLGQNREAFEWLEKAYQDRFWMMAFFKVDPRFDALRSDPRFADLLRRMNFPTQAQPS